MLLVFDPPERLRLMAGRHTFRKDRKDKMILIGRNNCSTCHSKVCLRHLSGLPQAALNNRLLSPGVTTGGDTTASAAAKA
jgi:hypothetical protein